MLKNKMKTIQLSVLAAAVAGAMGSTQAVAEVDVSASVSVASMYLFRGKDLSDGLGMVSGDLVASSNGFYGGVWGTSGDKASGTEYDLFVGYATEIEGVSLDINVTNYIYPSVESADGFGDFSEVFLNIGYGPFSFDYQATLADGNFPEGATEANKATGLSGFEYYAVNMTFKQLTFTYGYADFEDYDTDKPIGGTSGIAVGDVGTDYSHVDISYAYDDNFTFTLSQIVDQDHLTVAGDSTKYENHDDELLVLVSYSLPIE